MKIGISVKCAVCGKTKAPRGRSLSPHSSESYCHTGYSPETECAGYRADPFPGDLFPGETENDVGYQCSDYATRLASSAELAQWEDEQRAESEIEDRDAQEDPGVRCPSRE